MTLDLETLIAREAIRDALYRYCRGLDRMDKPMARSTWHEDGTACYLDIYEGTGHGFIDWVWESHKGMARHSHQITNTLIEVDGDKAASEAYATITLWTVPDEQGQQQEIINRGRYLDRWSRRNGVWAIDHRILVLDTHSVTALSPGFVSSESKRDTDDPSYGFLKKG
jgi:hypothetical protein